MKKSLKTIIAKINNTEIKVKINKFCKVAKIIIVKIVEQVNQLIKELYQASKEKLGKITKKKWISICILLGILMFAGGVSNMSSDETSGFIVQTIQEEDSGELDEERVRESDSMIHVVDDFAAAREINSEIAAWLYVPGTDINNPVPQGVDNEFYLTHNEAKEYDRWGSYFADYYSILIDKDNLRQNTVIYGHSQSNDNPDGKKFSQLFRYLDIDFLKENHNLYLTLGEENLIFEICAVFFSDTEFYYIDNTPSEGNFKEFSDTIASKNEYIFDSGNINENDKLLTLSTCAHQFDVSNTMDHRLVIMGRLVEEETGMFSVEVNRNPKRP